MLRHNLMQFTNISRIKIKVIVVNWVLRWMSLKRTLFIRMKEKHYGIGYKQEEHSSKTKQVRF